MKIQDIKTVLLKPYKDNPREIGEDAVAAVKSSIEQFGFKVPLIVSKDYEIVAGHTRLKAAQELGLKTVPCVVADDLTAEQIKMLRLADNKVGELAKWDVDLLQKELAELGDFEVEAFGFTDEDEHPASGGDGTDADPPIDAGSHFKYQSQYGVIVMCKDEGEQERVYNDLLGQGYECKVVTT